MNLVVAKYHRNLTKDEIVCDLKGIFAGLFLFDYMW